MNKTPLTILLTLLTAFSNTAAAASSLSVSEFLSQVQQNNPAIQGAWESSVAAFSRSSDDASEAALLTSPALLGNAQLASDQKLSNTPLVTYDKAHANAYSLGLGWQTSFGLQAKVTYNLNYYSFKNVSTMTGAGPVVTPSSSYFETRPSVELTQPLWANGFGRSVRATQTLTEAQALSSAYGNRFQFKALLTEAETSYWRLALARQALAVQKDALDRANKIQTWSSKRVHLQLADEADVLQANALVEVRKLDYEAALNEAREASRAFNLARNMDSELVAEELADFNPEAAAKAEAPSRNGPRDDVRAAEQGERLAVASAQLAKERNTPTLDLFASYSLNGKNELLSSSLGDPFSANRPTQAVGIRLNMPLAFATTSAVRQSWAQEQAAAAKTLSKKQLDEEVSWKSLNERFGEAKRRFALVRSLENAQYAKLAREKIRLQNGRTVTFQVLLFEQDYLLAQLARIRSQAEILSLAAQLKLFGDRT
ncbi:MAG TPA: hypothetical protein DCS07_06040 [Bdellovibrionales bacterium]|nr:MAG: hypothetical protein A2Z97_00065 [Bdellovibrionales bacterium GWB1_52_6]OFZ04115.1 MAG: hypothetical protein A2X97_15050 [Bdellovibrionales bacterium GWA1_52_35]OFZ36955.1 MAG: hypothetical protein A2070_00035 [Bdellovibrionales bacterium GWC1_52_8]HAR42177.1 hypothetical protein [Bdellovibrionales bacterium]HCM39797.1 hypothetical protein [Bdellovibrionales bacterium]